MTSQEPSGPPSLRRGAGGWLDRLTSGGGPTGADGVPQAVPPLPDGIVPASLGRRVLGLAVDWAFAVVIANGLLRGADLGSFAPLLVLLVMHVLLVGTAGYTAGHWLAGLKVQSLQGLPPGPVRALVRAVLLCLAVPPLLWGADGRGLHDRLAGTRIVRR